MVLDRHEVLSNEGNYMLLTENIKKKFKLGGAFFSRNRKIILEGMMGTFKSREFLLPIMRYRE